MLCFLVYEVFHWAYKSGSLRLTPEAHQIVNVQTHTYFSAKFAFHNQISPFEYIWNGPKR